MTTSCVSETLLASVVGSVGPFFTIPMLLSLRTINRRLWKIATTIIVRAIMNGHEPWTSFDETRTRHPRYGGYEVCQWLRQGTDFTRDFITRVYVPGLRILYCSNGLFELEEKNVCLTHTLSVASRSVATAYTRELMRNIVTKYPSAVDQIAQYYLISLALRKSEITNGNARRKSEITNGNARKLLLMQFIKVLSYTVSAKRWNFDLYDPLEQVLKFATDFDQRSIAGVVYTQFLVFFILHYQDPKIMAFLNITFPEAVFVQKVNKLTQNYGGLIDALISQHLKRKHM